MPFKGVFKKMSDKIGVIGGGPAGIIAAGFASSRGKDVILIEKNNKIGKKLFITGKGRCNITNASSIENFFLIILLLIGISYIVDFIPLQMKA